MKPVQFINKITRTKSMPKYLPVCITPEKFYVQNPPGISEFLQQDLKKFFNNLDKLVQKGIEGKLNKTEKLGIYSA